MRKNAKLPRVLGKRIQKRRKELKHSQESLAAKIGISRAYMGYIEQGRKAPSLEILEKIARALGVKIQNLL
jgi:transcriptional regulator with XRE-family HTH domain